MLPPILKLAETSIKSQISSIKGYGLHTVRIGKLAYSLDFKIHGPLGLQWSLLSRSCFGILLCSPELERSLVSAFTGFK